MLVEKAATMAAATNTTQGTPMEEENHTPVVAEEEPPNKYDATMTTTTEQASITPLEDENPAQVVVEVPNIVEATLAIEKEAEVVRKEVVGGKEEENEGLERKDWRYEGIEAKNGKEAGSRGGDEHIKVEEEVGILGVVEAIKNDGSEKMTKDIEIVSSMVDPTLVPVVEKKLENSELEDVTGCLASLDAVEGGDKGELMKEEQQKEESIIEETMVEGDADSTVIEEEKPEPKGQKGEDVGFGGGIGCTLDEDKVSDVSGVGIEVAKTENKVAPFPQANNAINYDKESTDDTEVVGGQETPKESIGNDTNVEDETNMSEQGSEMAILAMNDGNVEDASLASADNVLDDSLGKKDADDHATTTEVEEEIGASLEEKVADNVSDDVEFAIVGKEKEKLEGKENEEVGSLGGGAGKLNEGKDIEVLVLRVKAIQLEDKVAPLAETNEKLCYGMEGSGDIVDVKERSLEEVTPTSAYCVLEDISKDCNVEGQATASEAKEEACVIVEMFVAEKLPGDAKSLLDKDTKPKLEGVKGEEIHYQSRDGGELDEEKEAKFPLTTIVCVEPKVSAMVVNDRSIEEDSLESEDNVLVSSLEKKENTEGHTNASEVEEEEHVVVELKVIDKVPDDIEFDIAELDNNAKPEGEKSEEIESIGGSGGELGEGKNIEAFTDSAEAIELEHKLVPLVEINENFGYVKEGNDDILDVNKGSLEVSASAYSVLEGITQKLHNVARQATSEEDGEVGIVLDMYVADNVPNDAKTLLEKEEKPKLERVKGDELGSRVRNGVEWDEEKETEVSIASIVFVESKACEMMVNNRSNEEVDLANEGSVLMGSLEKKQIIEGQTIADEVMEVVHVVVEPKVTDKVLDDIKSDMTKEDAVEQEGDNIGTICGNGGEIDDRKDVVSIEAIEFEDKLYTLAETNEKIGYVKQGSDDIMDVNEGTVEEEVNDRNKEEVDLACDDTVLVGSTEKKQNAEFDMAEEEKAEIEHEKGGELDEDKDVEVFTTSVEATKLEDKSDPSGEANKDTGYVKEQSDDIMVVNEGSVEEITPASVFSVLEDISKTEHNVEGQVTISDVDESGVLVEMSTVEKVPGDAKSLPVKKGKPKLEGEKGKDAGSGGRASGELDEEKQVKLSVVSIIFVEPDTGAMVVNETSIEEVAIASEDSVLMDSQTTANEVKEEVHVLMEAKITDTMLDDREFDMAEEGKGEPECEKSEEIGCVGGNGGQLDEENNIEISIVTDKAIEFEHKLAPSAETNENLGYVKEGSDDIVYVHKESVEEVTATTAHSVLEAISKEHNSESQAITSEVEEEVSVVEDMHDVDKVVDYANSLLAMEAEPKLEGVKDEDVDSEVWDGVEFDKEKQVEVSIASIMFVEQEACKMEVNNRSKQEVDLAFEEIVLSGSPENKQNIESDMVKNEKEKTKGDKGGKLDKGKDVEVMTFSIEATELEDKLAHLAEANKEMGHVKEGGDDIMVGVEGTVEEVTPASSYGVLEDISKMENNVVGQATPSEVEDICIVMEMYVADKMPDDAKSLLVEEKNPELQGVNDEEAGSSGELDKEKETEVSVVSMLFVEPEAGAKVVNYRSIEEVALASEDSVIVDSPEMKQNVEGQTTANEVKEDVHVVMKAKVTDTGLDDREFDMAEEGKEEPKVEKSGQFATAKDIAVSVFSIEAIELEHKLASLAKTNENFGHPKEGNNDIADVNKESIEMVTPSSVYSMLEGISKDYNVEVQATASKWEEEVGVVVDMHAADMVPDDAKSLAMEKSKLECVKGEGVESGVRDRVELNEEKEVEVSIASIVFNEQEACAMEVNDRSTKEVDLAFEDIVLVDSPEKKQNIESTQTKGEKRGELDDVKCVEVFNVSVEATELDDKLCPLAEANKEVGYVKEGSDDIMVVMKGSVEEVTLASSYCVLEDTSKKENTVKGHATASKEEKIGVVVEMYVEDKVKDDAKFPLVKEENLELEGVKSEEAGSGGDLDEEKESEISMASIVFVETKDKITSLSEANDDLGEKKESSDRVVLGQEEAPKESMDKVINVEDEAAKLKPSTEVGTLNDRSVDEVALGSAYLVLKNSPNKEQNVEGQATISETREEVCVATEVEVTNKVSDDTKHVVTKDKTIIEGEKCKEVGFICGDGGDLDDEKEVEVFTVIVDVVELEDNVTHLTETSGRPNTKKGSDEEVVVGDERAHKELTWNDVVSEGEVAKSEPESEASAVVMKDRNVEEVEVSAKCVHENSSWKEHSVEGQATTSEVEEEVSVIMETEVADDAKFVLAKEEELELQGEKGGEVGFGDGDCGILYAGKDVEVFVVSTTVVEPEDKITSFSKSNDEFDFEKLANNDITVMGDETPKESTENDTYVEDDATNLEQLSEMSIVVVNDGSIEEIAPTSTDSVLKNSPMNEQNTDSPMKEQNTKRQTTSSEMKEEVDIVVQGKIMDKEVNKVESVVTEENKVELQGDKGEKVGFIGGDGDESKKEKKFEVYVEPIEFEGKIASVDENNFDLSYETKASNDVVVVRDEEAPEQSTNKEADIEKETSKPERSSKASIVVVNDETLEELAPTSAESVLKGSPIKEVNFEDQAIANGVMEDVGVEKSSKVENIATTVQYLGVEKSIKVENIVGAVKGVDVEKLIKVESVTATNIDDTLSLELPPKPIKENIDVEETKCGTNVIHREEEFDDGRKIEVVPGYGDVFGDKGSEYDDESNSDTSPTLVAILEINEAMKQIMKEHVEGSSNGSVSNSGDFTNSMDEHIMLDASKDDGDDKGFDSTAHASLLKAANGACSDENVIIHSQYGSEILTMDRPTSLESLAPSLRPTEHDMLVLSELAVTTDPTEMFEEHSKLHDKVELIRVKFMRLLYSLGATPKEMVVRQVLYRLGLVEGIIHGRQTKRAFSLDNAWKKALTFEEEGKDDLNFSCNILVLGKTGVGKSATINSIFGEEKSKTDAFNSATTSVQEIVGDVHGVKIRIIDTPGLQPNVMDQGSNRKILADVKKYTKKCPPDIVLYVDRLDCLSHNLNDLPLLKTITNVFGPSIWFNAIIALTHAASALEDLNGADITYEVLMAQTSHIIQQSIRHATGDMNLMNPVAFAENHSSCQRNHEDQKVLPDGQSWRQLMLLLCYSSKILCEANSLLKLNDPNPAKPFGFCFRSLPLPFLMSSLLELKAHPKHSAKQGGNGGDSDIELDDYFDEYDCKVKPPPSFDSDNPTYRYRFMEPTSTVIARPILYAHGWDHDCGYDGVSVEETLAILNMFPANVATQITKDKKAFSIHLESSIAAKHGENASSLARFDIQTVGRQLAYIFHGETKIKKNKNTGGFLVTFLGETVATGLKVEDQISLGKRLSLAASTGVIRAQGDTAYGANLEARLKDKAKPIAQSLSTLGFSLMKWRQELALGANLQSQISIGRGSKVALRLGLNNKLNGQIGINTSTSEQVQIALLGLVPIAASIYRSLQPSKPSSS